MEERVSRHYPLPDTPVFSDEEDAETATKNASLPSPRAVDDNHVRSLGTNHLSPPIGQQPWQSPARQHKRTPSVHREVKETLNARSEYTSDESDGRSHHRINQYVIKDEIGRGSYGAVHLATDQFGNQYAVKEFSKARLRKRAQSVILRHGPRGPGRMPLRAGFGAPDLPNVSLNRQEAEEAKDALFLIRQEIAIMKKLNHPNLVQLIEVLDDPDEDSLYMVLEMCQKGVIMKVGLDESAAPYPEESCRCCFRDLILAVEYLHAQGVVHRDIKPDNLLLTEDDVLKVVDFGVSEMFEKAGTMMTAKSAGSPAFLPPELCIARHGDVSGTAADIWSMGVSLYCLRYGKIPFERAGVLDMYEAIKTETPQLAPDENEQFADLIKRLMEKDPNKRITMAELREHPWVTKNGTDPLLSAAENCSEPIELNDLEVNHAFTRRMSHLLCVMKAISKFKSLLAPKDVAALPQEPIPKAEEREEATPSPSPMKEALDRKLTDLEKAIAAQAARVFREREHFFSTSGDGGGHSELTLTSEKGHGHDPTDTEPRILGIGTGGGDEFSHTRSNETDVVSDSPTAVDFNIYDRAFEAEVNRIKRSTSRKDNRKGTGPLYLTKHVGAKDQYKSDDNVVWHEGAPRSSTPQHAPSKFADFVAQTMKEAKDAWRKDDEKQD